MTAEVDYCADLVRRRDPDRYLATLYAPARVRAGLLALHALDLELMAVIVSTTEPMLGEIRLAWWRERLQALDAGEAPAQPVLRALLAHVAPVRMSGAALEPLEDAALALLTDDLASHAALRGGTLFAAALQLLIVDPSPEVEARARAAGRAWAAVQLVRSGRDEARLLASAALADARGAGPAAARPLLALTELARHDLAAGSAPPALVEGAPVPPGRQLRLLWSIVTGRG